MSGIDRPTGGDSDPDRLSGREGRPFPGAPADREPVSVPVSAPSMEQMRAAFARSSNSEELQAVARADEAAAGEAPAGKGAAAAKPGSGAAVARDAAAPRDPAAGDSGEQRGEEADGGAAEETPEQPVVLRAPQQEMPAAEAPGGDPVPLDGGRPDASSLENQPDARHEEAVVLDQGEDREAEPAAEGIEPTKDGVVATRSDAAAPEADDKPVVQGVVEPDRREAGLSPEEGDVGDTNASLSEVRLDSQSDDQHPVTRAEMKVLVAEMMAENNAKLDAMEARHKAEVDELKTKLEAAQSEQHPVREGTQAEESQAASAPEKQPDGEASPERNPDSNENPDVSDAEQRADRLPRGVKDPDHVPDDPIDPQSSQDASFADRQHSSESRDSKKSELPRWRRVVTSDRVGAAGTVASAVNSAAMLGVHASPEGMVSLGMAILGVAGLGLAKAEQRRKEKNERQD